MTVPALDTGNISILAWWKPSSIIVLSDVIGLLSRIDAYTSEYIDGRINIFPYMTLGYPQSYDGNWRLGPYVEVFVRIRADGYIIAALPAGAPMTKLILWQYTHNNLALSYPYNDMTTLGKAIQMIRYETNNHVDDFVHSSVKYWSYQYPDANYVHLFGVVNAYYRTFKTSAIVYQLGGCWGPTTGSSDMDIFWINSTKNGILGSVAGEQISVGEVNDIHILGSLPILWLSDIGAVTRYTPHTSDTVTRVSDYVVDVPDPGIISSGPGMVTNSTKSHDYTVLSVSGNRVTLVNDGTPIDAGNVISCDAYESYSILIQNTHYTLNYVTGSFKLISLGNWGTWKTNTSYYINYTYFINMFGVHTVDNLHGYASYITPMSSLYDDGATFETVSTNSTKKIAVSLLTDNLNVTPGTGTGYFTVTFGGNPYLSLQYDAAIEAAADLIPQNLQWGYATHHMAWRPGSPHMAGGLIFTTSNSSLPYALDTLTNQDLLSGADRLLKNGMTRISFDLDNSSLPYALDTLSYQDLLSGADRLLKNGMTRISFGLQGMVTPDGSVVSLQNNFVFVEIDGVLRPFVVVGDITKEGNAVLSGSDILVININGIEKAIARVGDPLSGGGTLSSVNSSGFVDDDGLIVAVSGAAINPIPDTETTLSYQDL